MTQAGEFSAFLIGDINNTVVDFSSYVTKMPPPLDFGSADLTVFVAGGGQTTTKMTHASVASNFQVTVLEDPITHLLKAQLMGLRSGSTIQLKTGRNTAPVQGDWMFTGTYTLFGVVATIATNNKPADAVWDFAPSDVALTGITPGWVRI